MQNIRSTIGTCAALLFVCIIASAQGQSSWRYWPHAKPPAGPGSSAPMLADSAGNLWIGGHYEGVYRFNGTTWTQEANGTWFQSMAVDPQGRVYAFINGELSRRNTTGWQYVGLGGSLNEVFQLTIDAAGNPWAVFEAGIASIDNPTAVLGHYIGGTWGGYSLPFEQGATGLVTDAIGRIWIGTSGSGLYRFNVEDLRTEVLQSGNPNFSLDTITCLQAGRNGEMWIGTPHGLVKYDGAGHTSTIGQSDNELSNKYVRTMTMDPKGVLWVVTGTATDSVQPLLRYDGERWSRIEGAPFALGHVWDIAASKTGEIWLGHTSGVGVYNSAAASVISNRDDLSLTLAAASPNPFAEHVSMDLNCRTRTRVTADIVDVQGRIVRNLADDEFPAGSHTLVWDGETSGGQPAANGVYYCRVRTGTTQKTVPLVRMK